MFRLLPFLLLVLHSIPFPGVVDAVAVTIDTHQNVSCCGDSCQCAASCCQCNQDEQEAPAPTKTPFTPRIIDLATPASSTSYQPLALTLTSEVARVPQAMVVIASHNYRQALLGRWQN